MEQDLIARLDTAILENRPGFVKLFLESNVMKLDRYLTWKKLAEFYEKVSCLKIKIVCFIFFACMAWLSLLSFADDH